MIEFSDIMPIDPLNDMHLIGIEECPFGKCIEGIECVPVLLGLGGEICI